MVVDPRVRRSVEDLLQHTWFSDDMATVTQARLVMGLDNSEGGDSGEDSSVGIEDDDCGKRKRTGSGGGAVPAKKKCFNQCDAGYLTIRITRRNISPLFCLR